MICGIHSAKGIYSVWRSHGLFCDVVFSAHPSYAPFGSCTTRLLEISGCCVMSEDFRSKTALLHVQLRRHVPNEEPSCGTADVSNENI